MHAINAIEAYIQHYKAYKVALYAGHSIRCTERSIRVYIARIVICCSPSQQTRSSLLYSYVPRCYVVVQTANCLPILVDERTLPPHLRTAYCTLFSKIPTRRLEQ